MYNLIVMKTPLAFRIRPKKIEDVIGQKKIVGPNGFLFNSIKNDTPISFILYGPPGCGKTTIAEAYANSLSITFRKINAISTNKKEIEEIINEAKTFGPYIVIIDEIHRLNKDKQDILLPYVEEGNIYLIGATTANPYISINKAIRSRCHLLEVPLLTIEEIMDGLKKAIANKEGLDNSIKVDDESLEFIAKSSNGDFRFALNYLEILSISFPKESIDIKKTKSINKVPNYGIDKDEDDHYNALSALQKSIRGSDVHAALYYCAKLCIVGDLQGLERRLLVTAYEDIGIANPQACLRTKIAIEAAETVGMPEAIIPLSVAIVELALSPKSKAAYQGMASAMEFAEKYPLEVKDYLKFTPVNVKEENKYPYDMPDVWIHLQYLPDIIKEAKFFNPNKKTTSSYEQYLNENYKKISEVVRSSNIAKLRTIYNNKKK